MLHRIAKKSKLTEKDVSDIDELVKKNLAKYTKASK
jgi:hypothetical protein